MIRRDTYTTLTVFTGASRDNVAVGKISSSSFSLIADVLDAEDLKLSSNFSASFTIFRRILDI